MFYTSDTMYGGQGTIPSPPAREMVAKAESAAFDTALQSSDDVRQSFGEVVERGVGERE